MKAFSNGDIKSFHANNHAIREDDFRGFFLFSRSHSESPSKYVCVCFFVCLYMFFLLVYLNIASLLFLIFLEAIILASSGVVENVRPSELLPTTTTSLIIR